MAAIPIFFSAPLLALQKIPKFHLISWIESVVKTFCDSPKTLQKLCISTKFPHKKIR